MSSYKTWAKNPATHHWEYAEALDYYFGKHNYGVRFADGEVVRMDNVEVRENIDDIPEDDVIDTTNYDEQENKYKDPSNKWGDGTTTISREKLVEFIRQHAETLLETGNVYVSTEVVQRWDGDDYRYQTSIDVTLRDIPLQMVEEMETK